MFKFLNFIQSSIDYTFKNRSLLYQAFVRRSYTEERGGENNELLEFIGDKALDVVVVKILIEKFGKIIIDEYEFGYKSKYSEADLSKMKREVVSGKTLARCIEKLRFHEYLIMGKGDVTHTINNEISVKEDLFEAIVGAVTIDCNWNIDVIEHVIRNMIDFDTIFNQSNENDYVTLIQQWSQKNFKVLPLYCFYVDNYRVICHLKINSINGMFIGNGRDKIEARYDAAKSAYQYLLSNNLILTTINEIGEINIDNAINKLQELAQKGYIPYLIYNFDEKIDNNGNSIWYCYCFIEEYGIKFSDYSSMKKDAKKKVAYQIITYILQNNLLRKKERR